MRRLASITQASSVLLLTMRRHEARRTMSWVMSGDSGTGCGSEKRSPVEDGGGAERDVGDEHECGRFVSLSICAPTALWRCADQFWVDQSLRLASFQKCCFVHAWKPGLLVRDDSPSKKESRGNLIRFVGRNPLSHLREGKEARSSRAQPTESPERRQGRIIDN